MTNALLLFAFFACWILIVRWVYQNPEHPFCVPIGCASTVIGPAVVLAVLAMSVANTLTATVTVNASELTDGFRGKLGDVHSNDVIVRGPSDFYVKTGPGWKDGGNWNKAYRGRFEGPIEKIQTIHLGGTTQIRVLIYDSATHKLWRRDYLLTEKVEVKKHGNGGREYASSD